MSTTYAPRRAQAGFTLMEVMVALVIFAISVVGLVALQARSLESQRAANDIREAERVAQEAMSELLSRGFRELVEVDFSGNANPRFPYDDALLDADVRMRDYRRPPADVVATSNVVGSVRGQYMVYRQVDMVFDAGSVPSNPPGLPADLINIDGLELEVTVMWLDGSNPAFPPPSDATVEELTIDMIDPTSDDYSPWVGQVRLRTVRVNDVVITP